MASNPVFLEIAIWEFCSDRELKPLDDLIRRKYSYLRKCRDTDLLSLPDDEAQHMHQRIISLEKEVSILYAAKNMVVQLRRIYAEAAADLGQAIHEERCRLLLETQCWRSRYEAEHQECIKEKELVLFWIEQALKHLRNGKAN